MKRSWLRKFIQKTPIFFYLLIVEGQCYMFAAHMVATIIYCVGIFNSDI